MLVAEETEKQVARPLKVLAGLIKQDLKDAEKAGEQYYCAAGEKLIEAKSRCDHGEFMTWVRRNFKISHRQATNYMALAEANQNGIILPFSKITNPTYVPYESRKKRPKIERPKINWEVLRQAEMERSQERDLQRKMALQIIDIGYKFLANKLHPDKGGSKEAMVRLNEVRTRLKLHA
jgi:hypothetical protein